MNYTNHLFAIILFTAFSFNVCAQASRSDYALNSKMEKAQALMEQGDYESANATFRNILATEKTLPTNLSYQFAVTLYHIGQYKNSQNFIQKYLDLTRSGGDYYGQALELQKLLKSAFEEIEDCELCDISGYKLISCSQCNGTKSRIEPCSKCRGVGKINCQKCKGEGVVITLDNFGEKHYQTCDRCNGKGSHTCPLCEGEKELNLACTQCLGTGLESSSTICKHE